MLDLSYSRIDYYSTKNERKRMLRFGKCYDIIWKYYHVNHITKIYSFVKTLDAKQRIETSNAKCKKHEMIWNFLDIYSLCSAPVGNSENKLKNAPSLIAWPLITLKSSNPPLLSFEPLAHCTHTRTCELHSQWKTLITVPTNRISRKCAHF